MTGNSAAKRSKMRVVTQLIAEFRATLSGTFSAGALSGICTGLVCLGATFVRSDRLQADDKVPPVEVEHAQAETEAEMKPYKEIVEQTEASLPMVTIPSGTFVMGSPEDESERREDEGPQREIEISPFRMSEKEITRTAYAVGMSDGEIFRGRWRKREA